MTSKEAKKILNEYRNRNYNSTFRDELELAKAIDAILSRYVVLKARDTPLKVAIIEEQQIIGYGKSPYCPNCHNRIYHESLNDEEHETKICPKCGQRLDWEWKNEKQ